MGKLWIIGADAEHSGPLGEAPSPGRGIALTRLADTPEPLITIRDWLRFAVSRFNASGLAYGHGTSNALDEAAFLILETLRLPIDSLEPWLDARLTRPEQAAVAAVIDARIASRKPASYLVEAAYIRGHRFHVDERTIVPRSYIGELLCDHLEGLCPELLPGVDPGGIGTILDLCTGGGSLAILAARAFPVARVDAADISDDALAVAARNVSDHGLDDRVRLVRSDLLAGLGGRRYDLILANPPYVTDAAMAQFPPEYRAEPALAHAGGADGLGLVRRILAEAGQFLTPGGHLVVEVGRARELLEAEFPALPFVWLDTAESVAEVLVLPAAAFAKRRRPTRRP